MIRRVALLASAALALASYAQAAPPPIRESVAVCDPNSLTPACLKPNADGSINVSGGGSGGGNAAAGTNGATAPTSSSSTGFTNGSGNETAVSPTTPLPVGGSSGGAFDQGVGSATANTIRTYLSSGTVTATGSASTALNQGTGTANANSANVYIGGSVTQATQGVTANGATASGNPQLVAGYDGTTTRTLRTAGDGSLAAPQSALTNQTELRVVWTAANAWTAYLYANGSTTATTTSGTVSGPLCPATTNPVAITAYIPATGSGVGMWGQTMTSGTPGSAVSTTPTFVTAAANFTLTPLVAKSYQITLFNPSVAQTTVCDVDTRQ